MIAANKPPPSHAATSTGLLVAQAESPILNGRPFSAVGPPITIYEPTFSTFRAMNEGKMPVEIGLDDYEVVKDFLVRSSRIYSKENLRQSAISTPLSSLLRRVIVTITLADLTSNDGVIQENLGENACLLLLREIKNEVGSGNGDPSVQASFSYPRWWASPLVRIVGTTHTYNTYII